MLIGLYDSFDPFSAYRVLKTSTPGLEYKTMEPNMLALIKANGLRSKKNALKIIKQNYLRVERKDGVEYLSKNYLHELSVQYSFQSIKPILLFALIYQSEIVRYVQERINLWYLNREKVDRQALTESAVEKYGDRIVVKRAVNNYLQILKNFSIIAEDDFWKQRKERCTSYVLRCLFLLYSNFAERKEIGVDDILNEISFTYVDLSQIEDTLREFTPLDWFYQKTIDSKKIIIKTAIE